MLVCVLVTVMDAPGTTAPLESRTMPAMVPVSFCAQSVEVVPQRHAAIANTRRTLFMIDLLFLWHSHLTPSWCLIAEVFDCLGVFHAAWRRHVAMKRWEPLARPLTPERRLVVSPEDLRSPLGTAAPTFQSCVARAPRKKRALPLG